MNVIKNCQDFEVKYISDVCVCVCDVHLYLYVFTEEDQRLKPVMATELYVYY